MVNDVCKLFYAAAQDFRIFNAASDVENMQILLAHDQKV
jgi:hypothetical protein